MPDAVVLGVEARAYNATIRNRRRELGLTQREVAQRAGVSTSIVGRLETLRDPRLNETSRKVLRALGLTDNASPAWLGELELYGTRTVERPVTEELVAAPERLGLPSVTNAMAGQEACDPAEFIVEREASRVGRRAISTVLATLDERSRRVIEMRYGFGADAPKTHDEIGRSLDLTRERVRQIEDEALGVLWGRVKVGW